MMAKRAEAIEPKEQLSDEELFERHLNAPGVKERLAEAIKQAKEGPKHTGEER